jgi:hypothetical protein
MVRKHSLSNRPTAFRPGCGKRSNNTRHPASAGPVPGEGLPSDVGWRHLPIFDWPTRPSWLFRLTEGVHIGLGLVVIPVVLAKLWSVVPKLFSWPPARSLAHVLERLSLLLLVGGILVEIITGVLNIQYDYIFGFSFYTGHYYGAMVFIGAFVVHVGLKLPTMIRSLRSRSLRTELRTSRADTDPNPPTPGARRYQPGGGDPEPPRRRAARPVVVDLGVLERCLVRLRWSPADALGKRHVLIVVLQCELRDDGAWQQRLR